ncbi:hypothetical protein BDF22DRAFT_662351 [Syncephalis plumigaleata]|nr:hypothetical protein BDF22DRAFT_662351 [Syncephalis plumigaleata]
MTVVSRQCDLLIFLNTLPFSNFWRFLLYLDGATVVRLSFCSRALRNRICADVSLWKRLYHAHFLAGPHAVKELDFLYWCARDYIQEEHRPINMVSLLQSLNWYDAYRRRVCIERNWRYGNSVKTTLSLPPASDTNGWIVSYSCSTAVLLNSNAATGSPAKHIVGLECTAKTSHLHSLNANYAVSASSPPKLISLGTTKENAATGPTQTIMSDRFVVMLSSCFIERKARLEVRDRKTFQLKYTGQLPYKAMLRSINGQWALLSCVERQADDMETRQLIVLDLEHQTKHVKRVRTEWASMCLQQTSDDAAIVYTTRIDTVNYEGIDWATYKFSATGPPKRLQRGHLAMDGETIEYLCVHPLNATRVLLETKSCEDNRQLLIHSTTTSDTVDFDADMVEIPEEQVAANLLLQGISYQAGDQLFVHRDDNSTAQLKKNKNKNKRCKDECVYWPNAIKIQHLIGSLCIMHEWQSDASIRVVLVDIHLGEILRVLDPYNAYRANSYLMTSTMAIDNQSNKVTVIDYAALC